MTTNESSIQRAALQPVAASERIMSLDVVRGFALFGVLVAYAVWNLGGPPEETYGSADRMLNFLLAALVDSKFYTLFTMMFGLGFSIQLTRATALGVSVVPAYCRRLVALLAIGLLHALLLRNGDILVPYAAMGFVLLLFRNASGRALAAGAIIAFLFPHLARAVWMLTGVPFPARPSTDGMSHVAANFAWVRYWYATAIFFWPGSLPMFLFGLYLGKRLFGGNLPSLRRAMGYLLTAGLAVGVLALAATAKLGSIWANSRLSVAQRVLISLLSSAHAWGLAAFYASSLLLLLRRAAWQRVLSPLAAVGRMALTNYLLQSIVIVPLCLAFNLFDRVTPVKGLMLALVVWILQVPASVWWLRHHRFGPAEWVWRSLTYGRPQRMRLMPGGLATPVAEAGLQEISG